MKKVLLVLGAALLVCAAGMGVIIWQWTTTPHGRLTVPSAVISHLAAWQAPSFAKLPLSEQREKFRRSAQRLTAEVVPLADVQDRQIPGPGGPLPLRIYTPGKSSVPPPIIVYLHGGLWVFGDLETHDNLCRTLARKAGAIVVAVHYRLAPEHPYPAAAEDAYAAVRWATDNAASLGADAANVAVAGDSAGGNLAAALTLMSRDRGGPSLRAQVLIYPMVDEVALDRPSLKDFGRGLGLTADNIARSQARYLPDATRRREPYASPLLADDHHGLPPALIITAQFDPLRDEGEAYARVLQEAGIPVVTKRYEGVIHGFVTMDRWFRESADATDLIARWLRDVLSS